MTVDFAYVSKSELSALMPKMFEILYSNTGDTPFTESAFREAFDAWYSNVFPAMQKPQRQMVGMWENGRLIGFFQYYVNDGRFMMEEIQIEKAFHGTGVFKDFFLWLLPRLPREIQWVEAYALENNLKSCGILTHFGLELTEKSEVDTFCHYRGDYGVFFKHFMK